MLILLFFYRGNWIGEAPYKVGVPCSTCPPSYGGSCSNNMCFPAVNSNYLHWFKWTHRQNAHAPLQRHCPSWEFAQHSCVTLFFILWAI